MIGLGLGLGMHCTPSLLGAGGGGGANLILIAPNGAFPGEEASVSGGVGPYTWVVNGTVGVIVFADEIDASFAPGDVIRLIDSVGAMSNSLVVLGAPVNITPPTITGIPIEDEIISSSDGVFSGSGITLTYRWQLNGVDIPGQTGNTINVNDTGGTDGDELNSVVTATNGGGSAEGVSNILTLIIPEGFAFLRQPDNTVIMQPDGTPIQHPV